MSILSVEQLTKTYGEKVLFDQISFTIAEKQRIGLIGVNGTGKSSLLTIIAGMDTPDTGKVVRSSALRIDYLPQEPVFTDKETVLSYIYKGDSPLVIAAREYEEALYLLADDAEDPRKQQRLFAAQQRMDDVNGWDLSTQAKTILMKLGISQLHAYVSELSGGQRKRVALAAALLQPADLLILDEPTNHIDNDTVEWLEEMLSKYRGSIIMVTHDRYFLDRVTNRIFELHRGKLYSYEGNYATFLEKKADREEREAASSDKRDNLLRRELEWLKRGAKARTTKQKARIERAESLKEQQANEVTEAEMDMAVGASRLGKKIIELHNIAKSRNGKTLIEHLDYITVPHDRVGIIGPNGAGKSTLLQMIAGQLQPDQGEVITGSTVKIAFYTQDHQEMNGDLRVLEYIREAAEVIHTANGEAITASQMLERFLFNGAMQWTFISRLSGGERRRLYLLRTLMTEPNVLLLDEPTNDLDIQTLSLLEDYLQHFPGVVFIVSHDRYFLDRTVNRLMVFAGDGTVSHYYGNYSEYLEERKADLAAEKRESGGGHTKISTAKEHGKTEQEQTERERPRRKLSYKEQKEWDGIEQLIASLEEESERLKVLIAQAGSDFDKVQSLYEEEQRVNEQLEQALERWTELSELIEQMANPS